MSQVALDGEVEVEVCKLDELPMEIGRAFEVGGRTIAVFRTRAGDVRAVDDRCPHKGAPLSDGMIAGNCVVCPYHAFKYDLASGGCDQPAAPGVRTYPVRVDGEAVFVKVG
ncbi:MAG: nitrite reductase small subunit NirD, partial [Phycisphaerae bacterium]|nr:nitrite reductase small subunit NirD [Tepidisphaeraceae bacterium]